MEKKLAELEVLVLDCQATGANPDRNRLLEMGWARARASEDRQESPSSVEAYLARWSDEEEIPRRVVRVTGLAKEELVSKDALEMADLWRRLERAARDVARANGSKSCPTVIHFGRFEEPFLRKLHGELTPEKAFPFDIICTHEIVKRLLPDLPRRGLRAVAGFFGHSVPELRRSAHHVNATSFIWTRLVDRLNGEAVRTPEELALWMKKTEASKHTGRSYPMASTTRLRIPDRPGIYRMRRSNGDLLYIGKARSLHKRVNSYFQKKRHHPEHTLEMLTQARNVDVTVTETALEAAILESDEIKRHSPPYNIALRDRERPIWIANEDEHLVGPLPAADSLLAFSAIEKALEQGLDTLFESWPMKAGFLPEYAPEMDCFKGGFEIFREKHFHFLEASTKPAGRRRALTRLGAMMWHERLASEPETDESEEREEEAKAPKGWTPERICSWLEGRTMHGAHLLRRARWLCHLSESAIAWERLNGDDRKRLLVFSQGSVNRRENLPLRANIPPAPGYDQSTRVRQSCFDLATYDRLRIVTTELRRLVSEGRRVEIRLTPEKVMRTRSLSRSLPWV